MKKLISFIILIVVAGLTVWLFLEFGGRTPSRYFGSSARQIIDIPDMVDMVGNVNMWFDKSRNATVKDITYCGSDGYYYTAEFRDVSPFEGVIRWVPHNKGSDIIQSRMLSRWGLDVVNLKVPENFRSMYGVSIVSAGKERVKNLTFYSTDGKILAKEYREGLIDRFFGGYLQVKGSAREMRPKGTRCDATYALRGSP